MRLSFGSSGVMGTIRVIDKIKHLLHYFDYILLVVDNEHLNKALAMQRQIIVCGQ